MAVQTLQPTATAARAGDRTESAGLRLSPRVRKLLVAGHVILSVGWLGVVAATLVLALTAAGESEPAVARSAYLLMDRVLEVLVLPPPASFSVAAMLTGGVLALGTKWGLFRHYWIVVKLALTMAVLASGFAFVDVGLRQAVASPAEASPMLLVGASAAHLAMLGAATIISVFKPWGEIRRSRSRGD
jgi:hypothetical protein